MKNMEVFQFTRPRGARRLTMFAGIDSIVSIHTPAWGATSIGAKSREVRNVSIHTPAWGATTFADMVITYL
mgnify:FL=1